MSLGPVDREYVTELLRWRHVAAIPEDPDLVVAVEPGFVAYRLEGGRTVHTVDATTFVTDHHPA